MATISRQEYNNLFGPTVGDKIRLGDTDLYVEIEKDLREYGDEVVYGGGKTIRDGMVSSFQFLPGGFYHGIHIPDAVTDQPVHTDLKVGHPPGKIGMFQKFAQQPMIEFSIP